MDNCTALDYSRKKSKHGGWGGGGGVEDMQFLGVLKGKRGNSIGFQEKLMRNFHGSFF